MDYEGRLTGIEMRGPDWRGFSEAADKTLFRLLGGGGRPVRLAVTEAPIEAISLAALEDMRPDTLYLGVAGGMGPHTVAAPMALPAERAGETGSVPVAATPTPPASATPHG